MGEHRRSGTAAGLVLALGLGCGEAEGPAAGRMEAMQAPAGLSRATADAPNSAPVIESVRFEPAQPRAGVPVRAVVEVRDDDGDPVRLAYLWRLEGENVPGDARVALSRSRRGDRLELRVTASDGRAESRPVEASTRVHNQPPRLRGVQIEPADRITAGTEISVRPAAEDGDGDSLRFGYTWWVNDEVVEGDGPLLPTRNLRRGDRIRVRVVASDGYEQSNAIMSPEITVANAPPRIVSEPGAAGADGSFRYEVRVEDLDRDPTLRFSLAQAPEGMTIGAVSGVVAWRPRAEQTGTHPVEVVVEDLQGGRDAQRFEVSVGVEDEAPAPSARRPGQEGRSTRSEPKASEGGPPLS